MSTYPGRGSLMASDTLTRTDSWVTTEPGSQYFDTKKAKDWVREKIGSEDKVETEVVDIKAMKSTSNMNSLSSRPKSCPSCSDPFDHPFDSQSDNTADAAADADDANDDDDPDEESKPVKICRYTYS